MHWDAGRWGCAGAAAMVSVHFPKQDIALTTHWPPTDHCLTQLGNDLWRTPGPDECTPNFGPMACVGGAHVTQQCACAAGRSVDGEKQQWMDDGQQSAALQQQPRLMYDCGRRRVRWCCRASGVLAPNYSWLLSAARVDQSHSAHAHSPSP